MVWRRCVAVQLALALTTTMVVMAANTAARPAAARAGPSVSVVSVMAEGEAGSAAYRIPGLLFFKGRLLAIGTARTQGCKDRDSGPHNLVLRTSDDGGALLPPNASLCQRKRHVAAA